MDKKELDDLQTHAENVSSHIYDPETETWQEKYTGPKVSAKKLKKRVEKIDQLFEEDSSSPFSA